MYQSYLAKCTEREQQGVAGPSLTSAEVEAFFSVLANGDGQSSEEKQMLHLVENMTPPGVDDAALTKSLCLTRFVSGEWSNPLISPQDAVRMLGSMQGGYNIEPLLAALSNLEVAEEAANALKNTVMVYESFDAVTNLFENGNTYAGDIIRSWANAGWFYNRPALEESLRLTVFKVDGETNTDDLSPAQDAFTRPEIPLHAQAMYKNARPGILPDKDGVTGCMTQISEIKAKGNQIAFVGDVVGTGSSRKSAANSVIWHFGRDIPYVPNKRTGGVVLASKIAPIFYATLEDSGALPIECDISKLNMGDEIILYPSAGVVRDANTQQTICSFLLPKATLLDEVRAGGRIPYLIGKRLTLKAREYLQLPELELFADSQESTVAKGYTLAQKMVGRACGKAGVLPGEFCEPTTTTVGSQDTTGAMTRDEIKDLACLSFSSPLVMQSFCHTSAYPREVDAKLHRTLPSFFESRQGVALRPGDGVIHSWLNRTLLPDTVGTGGDSHTRFPIGISFPAGSGLVAYAAAAGTMPLTMPESVLVRFKGEMQPGITLRDLVHAIPLTAIEKGLLNTEPSNKVNVFNGRILEIEGLEHLNVDQAFELTDASAERSAAACTIKLRPEAVTRHIKSSISMLEWMVREGYGAQETLRQRIIAMREWLAEPTLLEADSNASYTEVIEIDLNTITEPVVCCPNDPDKAARLSDVAGTEVDEVFIGSCMTNIGHFRACSSILEQHVNDRTNAQLWLAPPTRMDDNKLHEEGRKAAFARAGSRIEMAGCSLCMGNQARVAAGCTAVSTSTRNFPNRLGQGANVFLASAELATVTAILGRLPTKDEYQHHIAGVLDESLYKPLRFDLMPRYNNKLIFDLTTA